MTLQKFPLSDESLRENKELKSMSDHIRSGHGLGWNVGTVISG
jgi:hypothetical protein